MVGSDEDCWGAGAVTMSVVWVVNGLVSVGGASLVVFDIWPPASFREMG